VEPLGRCGSRTRTQPGRVAMTGRIEGRYSHVDKTVPATRWSGLSYRGELASTIATWVTPAEAIGAGRAPLPGVVVTGGPLGRGAGGPEPADTASQDPPPTTTTPATAAATTAGRLESTSRRPAIRRPTCGTI